MTDRGLSHHEMIQRIASGRIKVAVIGLGYVGLPLALLAARKVNHVVGLDVSSDRVRAVSLGNSYIDDITDTTLENAVEEGRFNATDDYAAIADCDVVVICVPTPLRKTGDPDLSFIVQSVEGIRRNMRRGTLVVLESTSYPGTTDELVCPHLEETGMIAGRDFWLAFSPERIDPGPAYKKFALEQVPKVVGGITVKCTEVAAAFYGRIVENVVPVHNSRVAEMVKLLENTYRAVNIALVNELAQMSHALGIDVWEVIDAAKTKPYGFQAFYPGPGLGGHCIPVDPFYLAWKARLHGFEPRFIDLAGRVNTEMPPYVVQLAMDLLNDEGKALRGSHVHIMGIAYKRDVSDTRESPALVIIDALEKKGARVTYTDSWAPQVKMPDGSLREGVKLTEAGLRECDLALIVTDHSNVDYDVLVREAPLILDTRNVLKGRKEDNIHRL